MTAELDQLLERFAKPRDLLEAVKRQHVVQGNDDIANALVAAGSLVGFDPGATIIRQEAFDRTAYLLLAGKVSMTINGCPFPYGREAGDILGEMSAINPQLPRTATIEAIDHVAALKVDHSQLADVGRDNFDFWRLLAVELTRKLEQRNQFVDKLNKKPRVFMISASERLDVAQEIRAGLAAADLDVVVWSDAEIFPAGSYPLDDLRAQVALADFGIALAHPEDIRRSRKKQAGVPRDNVVFELGYFMSVLGRARTFVLVPEAERVELPSDFKGLTPLKYKEASSSLPLSSSLGPTVHRLKSRMSDLGARSKLEPAC